VDQIAEISKITNEIDELFLEIKDNEGEEEEEE